MKVPSAEKLAEGKMGKFANNPCEEESADNTSGDDNCHDVVLIAYLVHLP